MLTHAQIWNALDRLAARSGLSPSGLAKKAGLDPTTFNKSKRITPEGRQRWPSTESVAKSLAATSTNVDTFVQLIGDANRVPVRSVPLIGFAQAGSGGYGCRSQAHADRQFNDLQEIAQTVAGPSRKGVLKVGHTTASAQPGHDGRPRRRAAIGCSHADC